MKKTGGWLLRLLGIGVAIALLCLTVYYTGARPIQALRGADPLLLFMAFGCIGITHLLGGYRLGRLLAVHGVHLNFFLLFRLTLIGAFFSQIIPGAVSGDLVKLAIVVRRYPGRGAAAVMSGMIDRVIGVSGLFLVASLCGGIFWLMNPAIVAGEPVVRTALLAVFMGGVASLCGLGVMVYHSHIIKIGWIHCVVTWLGRHSPCVVVGFVERLCASADAYRHHKKVLLEVIAISMIIHFLLGVGVFCTGRALGEDKGSFGVYLISMQVGNAVTLIPVTPGGLGMRESMTATMFMALGNGNENDGFAGSVPVVNALCNIAWALIGAIALGTLPRHPPEGCSALSDGI
ncbi:MAG: flippase-like domain-containing protein [Victivallales bacterium]|nr:flippase-like domain-containing protein [Victivallales bacterium]